MTEDEAKKKWCPMVRFDQVFAGKTLTNRQLGDGDRPGVNCIASACMAWRWTEERGRYADTGKNVPISGYCGLAGKP